MVVPLREVSQSDVYIPGIKVHLTEVATSSEVQSVLTDLSGRFHFAPVKPGDYKVCWEGVGYVSGCMDKPITLAGIPIGLGRLTLQPQSAQGRKSTLVMGKVHLGDGQIARYLEPLFNINSYAHVTLLRGAGDEIQTVAVNNFGEYVLPDVPNAEQITLIARVEGASTQLVIEPENNLAGSKFHQIDLWFKNRPPRLQGLVPLDNGGQRLNETPPGSSVNLRAVVRDDEGDKVRLYWRPSDGSGSVDNPQGPSTTWTLPSEEGKYDITLVAWDGNGGYDRTHLSVLADKKGVRFTGVVAGTDVATLAGGIVSINGVNASPSGADGYFDLRVPGASRYVMTIKKPGYATFSRVFDTGATGGKYSLVKTSQTTVDPTKDIQFTERRPKGNCPGRASDRLDWGRYGALLQNPQYQNGSGTVVGQIKDPKSVVLPQRQGDPPSCGPGTSLKIPANSIVDPDGNLVAGNITLEVATLDLNSPDQMPGDYTVQDVTETKVAQSWGAVYVSLSQGTTPLNLKPGTLAEVTIPVDPSQLKGGPIPATIPIMFYNEASGMWVVEGQADRVGNTYVAKVPHFSTINMDLVKTNQACVRVNSPLLPGTYQLEITVPLGGGAAPRVVTRTIDNSSSTLHVLYNLPTNTNITLVPYNAANLQPFTVAVVNTGAVQNPTSPNLPTAPYAACSTEVILQSQSVAPLYDEFLQGLYSFEATNLGELNPAVPADAALATAIDTATTNYYANIDPCGKRSTLTAFRTTNNYAAGETRASYANVVDLGFGRDMHCAQTGANVACYVTNYGDEPSDDQTDANDAVSAGSGGGSAPIASVAMEYSPLELTCDDPTTPGNEETLDTTPTVKFLVYNGAGTGFLNAANLDGNGARPIPQLCMVCHGGTYPGGITTGVPPFNTAADVKLGSRFLPFDLAAYTFPNNDVNFNKANQQAEFLTLNNMVVATEPAGSSVREVITAMYPGGVIPQSETFVIPGWNSEAGHQVMYRDVVGKACRTCHVTHPQPSLQFRQASDMIADLGLVEYRVCNEGSMPHALRTHDRFWSSVNPSQVAQLQAFGDTYGGGSGWQGDECGVYTSGGSTPVTFYGSTIQPIFDGTSSGTNACIGCHVGSTPPASLKLDQSNSHAQLVSVASTQLPAMPRVTPNNVAQSYLVHKLNGTQAGAGGSGGQMPPGGAAVNAPSMTNLQTWINTGALP